MADELNIPTHRWYERRNNISLANADFSKQWIYDSGIQKIDNFINGAPVDPATSVQLYTRSGDTILDRANSTIERRAV